MTTAQVWYHYAGFGKPCRDVRLLCLLEAGARNSYIIGAEIAAKLPHAHGDEWNLEQMCVAWRVLQGEN